jgi:hypothetical protein
MNKITASALFSFEADFLAFSVEGGSVNAEDFPNGNQGTCQ